MACLLLPFSPLSHLCSVNLNINIKFKYQSYYITISHSVFRVWEFYEGVNKWVSKYPNEHPDKYTVKQKLPSWVDRLQLAPTGSGTLICFTKYLLHSYFPSFFLGNKSVSKLYQTSQLKVLSRTSLPPNHTKLYYAVPIRIMALFSVSPYTTLWYPLCHLQSHYCRKSIYLSVYLSSYLSTYLSTQ